jgi:pimeloyl-ACP methyl ester carboxylesterase
MRAWLRRRRLVLVTLLAGYLMLWLFGGCADKLILLPNTEPAEARGAERRVVPFQGGELEVWVSRSPGARTAEPEAFVLAFTGNAGRVEWTAMSDAWEWGEHPVEVWSVNHPGIGGSTGPAKLSRLAPAALAAYDALAARAGGRPVLVSGVSLGTTMALHAAENRPVAGMVLRTPPPLQNLIMSKFGWWNLWLLATPVCAGIPSELNILRSAPKVHAPAVFLLMDTDEVVPLEYQRKVLDAYAGEKRVVTVRGGNHNSAVDGLAEQELREQGEWLWAQAVARARK